MRGAVYLTLHRPDEHPITPSLLDTSLHQTRGVVYTTPQIGNSGHSRLRSLHPLYKPMSLERPSQMIEVIPFPFMLGSPTLADGLLLAWLRGSGDSITDLVGKDL